MSFGDFVFARQYWQTEPGKHWVDMARQKGGFDTFVTRESRVIRDWTFEGPKNYTMDVIGVISVIM